MPDSVPAPLHLDKVMDGLAANPAPPPELVRRLLGRRTHQLFALAGV
ncbi:hypothetical protein [Streptomyces venezuelae]